MSLTGIFGGTFDPPHIGHRNALKHFKNQIKPDITYIIPANIPPMKDSHTASGEHRLNMCRLCFDDPVLDLEIKSGGISYTWLTVEKLRKEHPEDELFMLIGTDQLFKLEKWKNIDYLKKQLTFAVAPRDRERDELYKESERLEKTGMRIAILNMPETEISSTGIRTEKLDDYLTDAVKKYIRENCLYGYDRTNQK